MKIKKVKYYKIKQLDAYPLRSPLCFEAIEDMLRYDACFVDKAYPSIVCYISFYGDSFRNEPTVARWHSFGFELEAMASIKELPADNWVTMRRYGAYDELTEVPLNTFLRSDLKDWGAVERFVRNQIQRKELNVNNNK